MVNKDYPLVTIGIPTYNRADGYLKQALQSAVEQTYPNIEIVVSDNCSPDQTAQVVKDFSDERIRYFQQPENRGANNNFNFCVDQAKGDYFLLLHDDDLIDKDFVQVCLASINYDTDIGIIRTGTRVINAGGEVLKEVPNRVGGLSVEDFFRGWFSRKTALYLCSTLFNTKRLREIGGFKTKKNLYQDVAAEFQLAVKFGRADVPEVKASFRKHAGEITFSAKVGDWCEDALELLELMCDLVPENKDLLKREGMRYFAGINYMRARAIKSFRKRLAACLLVFKKFNYRYLPPLDVLWPGNPLSRGVRYIKRRTEKPDNTQLPVSPQRS